MRFESRTALTLMCLRQAQDDEKIAHIRAELEAIRLHLKARREEKYSPEQPRDELGRWVPWDHGAEEGDVSEGDTPYGIAPDGTLIESIAECSGISAHALRRMQERGITPAAVMDALTNPLQVILQPNGNTLYIGSRARVVLSPNGWMVTCM